MTFMEKPLNNAVSRRNVMAGMAAFGLAVVAGPVWAISESQAKDLITRAVADINKIINSGKSEAAMLRDFEGIFSNYGDSAVIGQLVLGPDGRTASSAQKSAFAKAFQGYMSRKYGKRFREFIGGKIEVSSTRTVKNFFEVMTVAHLAGQSPFAVDFVVAEQSGRFIDMRIEGISLVKAERAEIGAMLDSRRGDLDRLIADLNGMG